MSARIHDLLEIDTERFLLTRSSVPSWVAERLREIPFVVVRRGAMEEGIPIGVRGARRNERWAGVCHPEIVSAIVTPPMLLSWTFSTGWSPLLGQTSPGWPPRTQATQLPSATRTAAIPALRSLALLAERWRELDVPWGPGGSVGFELATGRHATTPQSDLDIVIYADTPMTAVEAQTLRHSAQGLPAAVDVRVETQTYGFSLTEYASRSPALILLRLASGTVLGADPWAAPNLTCSPRATSANPTAASPISADPTLPDPTACRPATAASQ